MISQDEIEDVARAIYESEHDSRDWENEPSLLKDQLFLEARLAIAALDRLRMAADSASRHPRRISDHGAQGKAYRPGRI